MANDAHHNSGPTTILERWNALDADAAAREVLPCCGSLSWANSLAMRRPFASEQDLYAASDEVWTALPEKDWLEAFNSHPRIGQQHARAATAESLAWSSQEQRAAMSSSNADDASAQLGLVEGNRQYEERFQRIFIVCAAGKSAAEILAILNRRMKNTAEVELLEAAEEQRKITQLRLRRWLGVN